MSYIARILDFRLFLLENVENTVQNRILCGLWKRISFFFFRERLVVLAGLLLNFGCSLFVNLQLCCPFFIYLFFIVDVVFSLT